MKLFRWSIIFLLIVLVAGPVAAQQVKKIDEQFPIPSTKRIDADLKFAKYITIRNWDRQEIGITQSLLYTDEERLSLHQHEVKEENGVLKVITGYKHSERQYNKENCWSCEPEDIQQRNCHCLQITYELKLPPGMELDISTISGDITVQDYRAKKATLSSISGGIDIKAFQGDLRAKSISGFVDYSTTRQAGMDLALRAVTGDIFSDLELKLDDSTPYSKRLNRSLNGGGQKVDLETVSGMIYLRQQ